VVWRQAGFRIAGELICFAAAIATAHGSPAGPVPAPRTHGFMLYLSQPLGGGGGALRPKFGLRFEQVRMAGNTGAPDAGDPVQHRALVGFQMDGLHGAQVSNMRVEFGSHMTYDVSHGGFALQSAKAPPAAARPAAAGEASWKTDLPESRSFEARAVIEERGPPAHGAFALSQMREASPGLLRDVTAAAVATFKSRINTGQSQPYANHRPAEGRPAP
jgi:hypothetical protein